MDGDAGEGRRAAPLLRQVELSRAESSTPPQPPTAREDRAQRLEIVRSGFLLFRGARMKHPVSR